MSRSSRSFTPLETSFLFSECQVINCPRKRGNYYAYTVIRNCMPNARVIRMTVAKLGLPFSESAL